MTSPLRINLPALLLLLISAQPVIGQPSLSGSSPRGLIAGKEVKLHLEGDQLQEPMKVWTSAAAQIHEVTTAADGKSAEVKITIDSTTPVGGMGIIVATVKGVSDPLTILVDDMESVRDQGGNHTAATAQGIRIPAAIDGRSDGAKSDFYSFTARAGQIVSVEVVAQRIGSKMDPVLRLLGPNLNEILQVDDDPGLGADCRLQLDCPQAGTFFIEVRDNTFQGGEAYRLRVGDFPIIAAPIPLGGRLGSIASFTFAGRDAAQTPPMIVEIPNQVPAGSWAVSVRKAGGTNSAPVKLTTSELPEAVEAEPNDELGQATTVTTPCAVSGIFQCTGDADLYRFAAASGTPIRLTSSGRRFGSPAYVFMTLLDANGKVVTETKVTDSEELTLSFAPPSDGIYYLAARDLNRRGGAEFAYRIEFRTGPDFSLSLKNDAAATVKAHLPQGDGTFGLSIVADRQGYDGPITLGLAGSNTGFQLHGESIAAEKNETRLLLTVPPNSCEPDLQLLRLIGTATIEGRTVRRRVHTEAILRTKSPALLYPPAWQDGLIATATVAVATPLFEISSEQDHVAIVNGKGTFTFQINRHEKEFKADASVFVDNLPHGVQSSVESEKDQFIVTLACDETIAADEQTMRLTVIGEHADRGQTVSRELPVRLVAQQ